MQLILSPGIRWLVNHMMELGFSKSLSNWIGSNLKKSGEHETWAFNLEGAVQMFNSYRCNFYNHWVRDEIVPFFFLSTYFSLPLFHMTWNNEHEILQGDGLLVSAGASTPRDGDNDCTRREQRQVGSRCDSAAWKPCCSGRKRLWGKGFGSCSSKGRPLGSRGQSKGTSRYCCSKISLPRLA